MQQIAVYVLKQQRKQVMDVVWQRHFMGEIPQQRNASPMILTSSVTANVAQTPTCDRDVDCGSHGLRPIIMNLIQPLPLVPLHLLCMSDIKQLLPVLLSDVLL